MPTIFYYGPTLDREKTQEMISSFTETVSRLTGLDKSRVIIYLREVQLDRTGMGGELLEDNLKREGILEQNE